MSSRTMRSKLAAACLMIAVLISCSRGTSWSGRIVSKKERSFRSFIDPHVGFQNVLIVDGKRFEHVRGIDKFYVEVPELRAILFVTDEKDYSVTYHLYKMDAREDITIHAANSVFGHSLGEKDSEDKVQSVKDGIIILCSTSRDDEQTLESRYYLDTNKKAVVADKTLFYDKSGKLTSEYDSPGPF